MKARPLSMLPRLEKVAEELAVKRNIPGRHWNIGIHPVCYRCDRDGMGDHADDDQGETRIFCLLVDQVEVSRKVGFFFGLWDLSRLLGTYFDCFFLAAMSPGFLGCALIYVSQRKSCCFLCTISIQTVGPR